MCAEQQEHAQQLHATISTEQCFFPLWKTMPVVLQILMIQTLFLNQRNNDGGLTRW